MFFYGCRVAGPGPGPGHSVNTNCSVRPDIIRLIRGNGHDIHHFALYFKTLGFGSGQPPTTRHQFFHRIGAFERDMELTTLKKKYLYTKNTGPIESTGDSEETN